MIKKINDLSKEEIFKKCNYTYRCETCDLYINKWCLMKNSKDQMENYLGSKKMNEYLNREVEINE